MSFYRTHWTVTGSLFLLLTWWLCLQSVLMHFLWLYSILCEQFETIIPSVSQWQTGSWWSSHKTNTAERRVSLWLFSLRWTLRRTSFSQACTHAHTHAHLHARTHVFPNQLGLRLFCPFISLRFGFQRHGRLNVSLRYQQSH